jgi:hypothetical protein
MYLRLLKDFITPHGLQHELVLALTLLSSESSVEGRNAMHI